jgi:hypothetical protein
VPPSASAERDRDRHLTTHCWIIRLEFNDLDNLLIGNELNEAAVERVSLRGRLPGAGRRAVGKRDAKRATFPRQTHAHGWSFRRELSTVQRRTHREARDRQSHETHSGGD